MSSSTLIVWCRFTGVTLRMQSLMCRREKSSASPRRSTITLWKSSSMTGTMALVGYVM